MRNLLVFTTIILLLSSFPVSALTVKSVDTLGFDKSIIKTTYEIGLPSKLIITPVFMPNTVRLTEENWIKGIYYYTVQRLGYPTLPYHYLIDSKGNVYNSESTDDRILNIRNVNDNSIVIGYLAQANATTFADETKENLSELILDIANRNGINLDDVEVSGLSFSREVSTNQVFLDKSEVFGLWKDGLNQIKDTIRPRYSPKVREYNIEIKEVSIVSSNLTIGSETDGKIKITNKGPTNLYIGDSLYLLAEKNDGGNSRFYLNNVWVSQSQFPAVTESQTFKVDQTIEVPFKIKAPLNPGENVESFKIKLVGTGNLNSNSFELKVNVDKGGKKIVQIQETETNFLRVRSEPSTVSEEIGRVASGERYIVLEENENGFYKIDLEGGRSGWVAGWLTTDI